MDTTPLAVKHIHPAVKKPSYHIYRYIVISRYCCTISVKVHTGKCTAKIIQVIYTIFAMHTSMR